MDIPPYALKRLVNHSVSNDMTGRYLVLDIERLRFQMCRISDQFLEQLGLNDRTVVDWKPAKEADFIEIIQLQISLDSVSNL